MLDSKYLRENINEICEKIKTRGLELDVINIENLEQQRKELQVKTQELQNERNKRSKAIGLAKAKGEDVSSVISEMNEINKSLATKEAELEKIQEQLHTIYANLPNIPHESVPKGVSDQDNVEIRRWGEQPKFNFPIQDHIGLGEQLSLMDFPAAAKISGARFVVLKGQLAQLQRALIQFMLDLHTGVHEYQEIYVPYLVNADSLYGTGNLPKFYADLFHIQGYNLSLIPTAEVPVTNLVRDEIMKAENLPLKYVAHTPCFRSEAGSYGKDMQGMIRHHQFEKVELVQIVKPKDSYNALEELTAHAESVLQKLNLPYRVVALCTGDLGFASAKTYDLEVWLPGQNKYREISSCSNFEAFQARRMQARWRNPATDKPELVHTLNGSALAAGRTLIAIMENFQDEKGNIHIPEVLWGYMGGVKVIENHS
jgi:seryl-tRNA synthetase